MRPDARDPAPRHVVLAVDDPGLRAALAAAIGVAGRTVTIASRRRPLPRDPAMLIAQVARLSAEWRALVAAAGLDGAALVGFTVHDGETRVRALDATLPARGIVAAALSPFRQ